MTRSILALFCVGIAASGCASFTTQFADLGKVLKPGETITVVGKNDEIAIGRIDRLPETPRDLLVVSTASELRTFTERDIAKIRKRQWVPLQGVGAGAGAGALLVLGASCSSSCNGASAPAFAWASVGGGIAGLVWGLSKPLVSVYEYAATDVMAPALAFADGRFRATSIVSAYARWSYRALPHAGSNQLELDSGTAQFGSIEWDFAYPRILLRPSAGHDYAAHHLAVELGELDHATCEERLGNEASWPLDRKTAASLAARHVWCRIDYAGPRSIRPSVFVRIGPPVGSVDTADERATRVIALMRELLGDKLTVIDRTGGPEARYD